MGTRKLTPEELERITELAKRWGKLIVQEHWGQHVGSAGRGDAGR